jgi:16S rRNA G966 N2-methylase RsmD
VNPLYFGEQRDVASIFAWLRNRKEFPDSSVDLVYLDPPFNSNADYNVLFRETSGYEALCFFTEQKNVGIAK